MSGLAAHVFHLSHQRSRIRRPSLRVCFVQWVSEVLQSKVHYSPGPPATPGQGKRVTVVVLGVKNVTELYFEVFFDLKAFPVYLGGV